MEHKNLFALGRWPKKFRNDLTRIRSFEDARADNGARLNALELMTIVLEDRRFFHHLGVDPLSVLREVNRALTFRKHGGASTIDMQFVRTATGFRQHTIGRKLYEAVLAVALQFHCSKRAILRSYLACAFFGSGLIGADAAALKVFGKNAGALDLEEAAFIAAMLAAPRPLHATPQWEAKVRRRAAHALSVFAAGHERLSGRCHVSFES